MIARNLFGRFRAAALLERARNSAVGWSWALNGLRLALGLILLPLVLKKLPTPELGMYYVLLSLVAVVQLVDFGFGPTIGRFVSYAMGGAQSVQAHGMASAGDSGAPNYELLWRLLVTTRVLYRFLTLVLLVILGAWGTYVVELRIHETSSPALTRVAWGITLLSSLFDIYSNWWEIYLRSMNEVLSATRIAVLATVVRLVLSAALLVLGFGLLSLPLGTFVGSFLQRRLARRCCLRLLESHPRPEHVDVKEYLRLLWPSTWRLGILCVSGYLTVNANTAICLKVLGLPGNARYGLSIQLLYIAAGMASAWIAVKWPMFGQYYARQDFAGIQKILRQRIWLQNLSFLAMAALLIGCAPALLERFGSGKQILPLTWFMLLTLNAFLEMQVSTWGSVILLGNRFPFLWHAVVTNTLSLILSYSLIRLTSLGLGALVLGPLIAGSLFNYWYWPAYAARSLGTNLFRVIVPRASAAQPIK